MFKMFRLSRNVDESAKSHEAENFQNLIISWRGRCLRVCAVRLYLLNCKL